MAGLGRRSHYRKHLTDSVLHDLPEPNYPHERIAQIIGSRGGNFFDILVSPPLMLESSTSSTTTTEAATRKMEAATTATPTPTPKTTMKGLKGKRKLALLPTKFRKLVWVKRGDFVIVNCGEDNDDDDDEVENHTIANNDLNNLDEKKEEKDSKEKGIRYMVQHVLYKEQVKHLKTKGLWPDIFDDSSLDNMNSGNYTSAVTDIAVDEINASSSGDGDIAYDYLNDDDLLMNENTNRMTHLAVDDSEDESSSSEEEDSDCD